MRLSRGIANVILLLAIGIFAAAGALLFFSNNIKKDSLPGVVQNIVKPPAPTSTPFPFQELTIPYLRNREYKSELGELTKYSENTAYTSYLTSYTSDGLRVNGLLTIPKNENQKHPAIIFVHGYIPPQEYETTRNYASYVDYLARNGFVVFKIDLRGHNDSEGEAGGAYYSGDYVVDTLSAYSALQNADFVDADAIGLWGHSMAGNVTFRSFVAKGDIPALAIWAGAGYTYSDIQEYQIDDNSYRPPPADSERARERQRLRDTYGNFEAEDEFWKQIVPTNYLDGVSGNISLHHAINDNVVSIDYSRNLVSVLKDTEIAVSLNEYPSGGHNLEGATFTQAMQRTVQFFKDNLK